LEDKWVVVSALVQPPCAVRPRALPVLVPLYRSPEGAHGTRHRTTAPVARRLLTHLVCWFPARRVIVVTYESACIRYMGAGKRYRGGGSRWAALLPSRWRRVPPIKRSPKLADPPIKNGRIRPCRVWV